MVNRVHNYHRLSVRLRIIEELHRRRAVAQDREESCMTAMMPWQLTAVKAPSWPREPDGEDSSKLQWGRDWERLKVQKPMDLLCYPERRKTQQLEPLPAIWQGQAQAQEQAPAPGREREKAPAPGQEREQVQAQRERIGGPDSTLLSPTASSLLESKTIGAIDRRNSPTLQHLAGCA
jgi:hypothetical protein